MIQHNDIQFIKSDFRMIIRLIKIQAKNKQNLRMNYFVKMYKKCGQDSVNQRGS